MKNQNIKEGKAKAPAYIVTFSDMITLLLTFFVMLLSLADVQDPELFNVGRDSFIEAIQTMGLGAMFGSKVHAQFNAEKKKYSIDEPAEEPPSRTLDADQEKIRRSLQKLNDYLKNNGSQFSSHETTMLLTPIRFERLDHELDSSSKNYLDNLAEHIKSRTGTSVSIYSIGVSSKTGSVNQMLATKRAEETARYLDTKLSSFNIAVFSFGTEAGWLKSQQTVKSDGIWIAVVDNKD